MKYKIQITHQAMAQLLIKQRSLLLAAILQSTDWLSQDTGANDDVDSRTSITRVPG